MEESTAPTSERRIAPPLVQSSLSRRLSWPALFAGFVVSSSLQLALTILGAGVGTSGFSPSGRVSIGGGFGTGVWFAVSGMIALCCGGWVAGRLAGIPRAIESALHGFLTWCLAMFFGAILISTTAGAALGGGANVLRDILNRKLSTPAAVQPSAPPGAPATANVAATGVSGAAIAGFFVLILGAGAATLGGFLATPKNRILTSLPPWERRGRPLR